MHLPTLTLTTLATALLLAGCTSAPDPTPVEPVDKDQVFLSAVHSNTALPRDASLDANLVKVAGEACKAMDNGATWHQLSLVAVKTPSVSPHDWGVVLGTGVKTYCPRHWAKVEAG